MSEGLNVGLLWYDGDHKCPLTERVERAVARYEVKFGRRPNACYVNQSCLEKEMEWQGVRILGVANILPNHFWVGISEPAGKGERPRQRRQPVSERVV